MNFRKRIARRVYVARYGAGVRLPFYMKNDYAYIEDSLIDVPGMEGYDGIIKIAEGETDYTPASGDGWNEPRESASWAVEFHADPEASKIVKYKPGVFDMLPSPLVDIDTDVRNGYATIVTGEEKQNVINNFMSKYESILQEYLDERAEERATDNY